MKTKFRLEPFHGETKSLMTVCDEITDCHHSTPKWISSGKLVIRNYNIKNGRLHLTNLSYTDDDTFNERVARSKPEPGDLIITREAPMGEVCIIPKDVECCLGQRMVLIKPNKSKINNQYLLYALQSEYVQKQIQKSDKTGSIVSNLRIPVLRELRIPIFNSNIEKNIGDTLNNIVSKIELNNKINAELEAMAKLIYDYWFVQFDFPYDFAQGKPDANGKPYKSSGGKMVYNEDLKREIPEGWEVKKLCKLLNTELGGTPSTKIENYWKGDIPWLNSGEISEFPIIKAEEYITHEAIKNSATSLMPSGTCVLSITRHLRPSILAIDSCANQSVVGIYESNNFKSSYIYPYLKNEIPRLMSLRTGAQQPHINKGIVDNSRLINPPKMNLDQYYKIVEPMYKQINN